ncbi:leucyl/phenylalanyl-tRNA--protein transferase [Halovulum sp. GXIMD14793]
MRDDAHLEITPNLLLQAYAAGVFPMADNAEADEIYWVDPHERGIIPLDGLRISKSLRKAVRRDTYQVRLNTRFVEVVRACADREETWINAEILSLYNDLHRSGYAHSVEVWMDDDLAGGLYGVVIGGAFFGESMFSHRTDASKIALVHLVARLRVGGFTLLDTQFTTPHLERLGAVEISRDDYRSRLAAALRRPADFWRLPVGSDHPSVLQLSTQTS